MKLSGREAAAFCNRPDASVTGALLYGADAGRVMEQRTRLVRALMGGEIDDMRLTRLDAAEARRDVAAVDAALRARGFFAGRQVVLIEGGTDGLAKPLGEILAEITLDDAFLIVTADALPARSPLRKLFEGQKSLVAVPFYDDPPGPQEIETALREMGAGIPVGRDALAALAALSAGMDHGSLQRFLELVALWSVGRNGEITERDIAALAPGGLDTDVDEFVEAVAAGQPAALGPVLRRLRQSGVTPVTLLIALQRHFRLLLKAGSAGSVDVGLARIRPPLWGRRRDAVVAQLRQWHGGRLEQASRLLFDTDARIRSSARAPDFAVLERAALRLAMMVARR